MYQEFKGAVDGGVAGRDVRHNSGVLVQILNKIERPNEPEGASLDKPDVNALVSELLSHCDQFGIKRWVMDLAHRHYQNAFFKKLPIEALSRLNVVVQMCGIDIKNFVEIKGRVEAMQAELDTANREVEKLREQVAELQQASADASRNQAPERKPSKTGSQWLGLLFGAFIGGAFVFGIYGELAKAFG